MTSEAGPGGDAAGGDDGELAAIVADPDGPWLSALPPGALRGLAERLGRHADALEAGGRVDQALSASAAELRVYRALLDQPAPDPAAATVPGVPLLSRLALPSTGHARATARRARLLEAAGRPGDIEELTAELAERTARAKEDLNHSRTVQGHRLDRMRKDLEAQRQWNRFTRAVRDASDGGTVAREELARKLADLPFQPFPRRRVPAQTGEFGQVTDETARRLLAENAGTGDTGAEQVAGQVAGALGRLAPALVLAGRYVAAVDGADLAGYLARYDDAAPRLWRTGLPAGCPEPVARACLLSLEHLAEQTEAGCELLGLCAVLAPAADIPLDALLAGAGPLLPALGEAFSDPEALARAVGIPAALGLVERPDETTVRVDPAIRAAVQARFSGRLAAHRQAAAVALLAVVPGSEPVWDASDIGEEQAAALVPHLEALAEAAPLPPLAAKLLDAITACRVAQQDFAAAERTAARALAVKEEAKVGSAEVADALDLLARVRWKLGDDAGRRAALDRFIALHETDRSPVRFAAVLRQHARTIAGEGDHDGARLLLRRAVTVLDGDPVQAPGDLVDALERLAAVEEGPAAIETYRRALAVRDRFYGPDDDEALPTLERLAALLRGTGDLPAARSVLERAFDLHEAAFAPGRPRAELGQALLDVTAALGDRPAARAVAVRLLDLYAPRLGHEHHDYAAITTALVEALVRQDDHDTAATALERIAAAKRTGYGQGHREHLASLALLADVQRRRGDLPGTVTALERLAEAQEERHGDRPEVVAALLELGEAKVAAGDLRGALPVLQRAITVAVRQYGRAHRETARITTDVALVVRRAGDVDRARTLLEASLGLCEKAFGPDHAETARARTALADLAGEADPVPPPAATPAVAPAAVEDLDLLEPGWAERYANEDLRGFAHRLEEHAAELDRNGDHERALRALTEAINAERLILRRTPDEVLRAGMEWRPFAKLVGAKKRLLRSLDRAREAADLDAELAALHQRLTSWLPSLMQEQERREAETARVMRAVRRRTELEAQVREHRGLAARRIVSVTRRMTGTSAAPPASGLPSGPAPAARGLLELCAVLEPSATIPLDALTAPVGLLPDDLAAAAEHDPGLTAPLAELTASGLLTRDGTAARIAPETTRTVQRDLGPDRSHATCERAGRIVLTMDAASAAPHAPVLADALADRDPALAIALLDHAAAHHLREGARDAALPLLRRSLGLGRATYRLLDAPTLRAATRLQRLLWETGDRTAAAEELDRVAGAEPPAHAAKALHLIAEELLRDGLPGPARAFLDRELTLIEATLGPDDPAAATVRAHLADIPRSAPDSTQPDAE
ncbi:tetratricopeptide repeat protein [Actinomadura verrucosospora]|uniref:Tfp pilus assembly protein PilF n=1 Tax=Actinomadura verrucosospora TaxID=46165 RepID=A0A7D3ZJS1_ACTVE|nr:tetratricopeptide repeat protein [Actinomadura verrucosospora]QKG20002.1 Tfp pilus assembly protein PilF [Actinomadura verrucosospora]